MTDFVPCWWCGSKKIGTMHTFELVAALCLKCGARGQWKKNTNRAAQAWRRGPTVALRRREADEAGKIDR
jgi:hypothetical protein